MQAERDFGLHVGEFFLHQLVRRQRTAELLTIQHILPRAEPAILRRAQRAPGDAVTRRVEAGEGAFQTADIELIFIRHEHFIHHDLAGNR